jgi:hypothetical protein
MLHTHSKAKNDTSVDVPEKGDGAGKGEAQEAANQLEAAQAADPVGEGHALGGGGVGEGHALGGGGHACQAVEALSPFIHNMHASGSRFFFFEECRMMK